MGGARQAPGWTSQPLARPACPAGLRCVGMKQRPKTQCLREEASALEVAAMCLVSGPF